MNIHLPIYKVNHFVKTTKNRLQASHAQKLIKDKIVKESYKNVTDMIIIFMLELWG